MEGRGEATGGYDGARSALRCADTGKDGQLTTLGDVCTGGEGASPAALMARQQELLAVARRFISELEDFCALLEGQDHVTVTGRVGAVGAISRTAPAGLSPRQSEVARMLAEGWSNSEVAATLHISPSTARRHTSAVLTKLAVISRQEVRHVWCLSRDSPRRAPTD